MTSAYIEKVWTPATEGLFREGDELPIVVTFSDAVVVTEGMLRMYMDVHSGAALSSGFATYYGHAGSSELAFTYVVGPNNTKTDLALSATRLPSCRTTPACWSWVPTRWSTPS